MAYTKQGFKNFGDPLTAEQLIKMEEAIIANEAATIANKAAINSSSGTSIYGTSYIEQEDDLYKKVLADMDSKTVCLVIGTDTHAKENNNRNKYGMVMRKIAERLNADAIVHLGDMTEEDYSSALPEVHYKNSESRLLGYMATAYSTTIPFLHAIGHHELYPWFDENGNKWGYSPPVMETGGYAYPFTKAASITTKHNRNLIKHVDINDAYNYYVDMDMQKLRCIFLNSVVNFTSFADSTVEWVTDVLNKTPEEYKVCFFAHAPNVKEACFRPTNPIPNGPELLEVFNNYTSKGGTILGYFHGHTHRDNVARSEEMTYNLISTTCCAPTVHNTNLPTLGNSTTPDDRTGYNEYAFDVACIHTDTNTVNMFRFGAGFDRYINLDGSYTTNEVIETYTNTVSGNITTIDALCSRDVWHDRIAININDKAWYDGGINRATAYYLKLPVGTIISSTNDYKIYVTHSTNADIKTYDGTGSGSWVNSYTVNDDKWTHICVAIASNTGNNTSPGVVGVENAYKSVSINIPNVTSITVNRSKDEYVITAN